MKGVDTATQDFSDNIACTGAFLKLTDSNARSANTNTKDYKNNFLGIDFDASRCDNIYGNSDVVQPSALTSRFYIKY